MRQISIARIWNSSSQKNEKRHRWVRPMGGWNSTLQAAWYVRHAHWASLCYVPIEIWCFVNYIYYYYDMVSDTQFHKFYGKPFARVLYLFLMEDIGRWLPWVLPGSTGRFYQDDVAHHHYSFFIKSWKTSAVSTAVWMVGTQLCKLRGTSDTFVQYGFRAFVKSVQTNL